VVQVELFIQLHGPIQLIKLENQALLIVAAVEVERVHPVDKLVELVVQGSFSLKD
jgi:hypothetical protein